MENINTVKYWNEKWTSGQTGGQYGVKQYLFLDERLPQDIEFQALDLGCGRGAGVAHLSESFPDGLFVGMDFSDKAIDIANQRGLKNANFVCGDVYNYTPAFKFDYIIMVELLEHLDDPQSVIERYLPYCNNAIYISVPGGNKPFKEHVFAYGNMDEWIKQWNGKRIGEHAGRLKYIIPKED